MFCFVGSVVVVGYITEIFIFTEIKKVWMNELEYKILGMGRLRSIVMV